MSWKAAVVGRADTPVPGPAHTLVPTPVALSKAAAPSAAVKADVHPGGYGDVVVHSTYIVKRAKVTRHAVEGLFLTRDIAMEVIIYKHLSYSGVTPIWGGFTRAGLYVERGYHWTSFGRMSIGDRVAAALDLIAAACIADRHGIYHNDWKPGNVVVARGQTRVIDWGLAQTDVHVQWGMPCNPGTVAFQAPEAYVKSSCPATATFPAQLFAAALTALTLFVLPDCDRRHPLVAAMRECDGLERVHRLCQAFGTPACWKDSAFRTYPRVLLKDMPCLRSDVPRDVLALLQHALELDPRSRPQSVDAVVGLHPVLAPRLSVPEAFEIPEFDVPIGGAPMDRKRGMFLAWAVKELGACRRPFAIGMVVAIVDAWQAVPVFHHGAGRVVWRAAVQLALRFFDSSVYGAPVSARVTRMAADMLLAPAMPSLLYLARHNPLQRAVRRVKTLDSRTAGLLCRAFVKVMYAKAGSVDASTCTSLVMDSAFKERRAYKSVVLPPCMEM